MHFGPQTMYTALPSGSNEQPKLSAAFASLCQSGTPCKRHYALAASEDPATSEPKSQSWSPNAARCSHVTDRVPNHWQSPKCSPEAATRGVPLPSPLQWVQQNTATAPARFAAGAMHYQMSPLPSRTFRRGGRMDRRLGRWRPYRVECTGSLLTSEVKRHRARLVLGWGTAWEHLRVLSALSFFTK